jgi:threonine synthase
MALLAESEGVLSEPAGGVVVAGLRQLVAEGRIQRDESVVICITGSGLKTTELFKDGDTRRLHLTTARSSEFERMLADLERAPALVG